MSAASVFESKHPLIQHKLHLLRDKHTPTPLFRQLITEITLLLIYENSLHFPLEKTGISTPIADCDAKQMAQNPIVVPILRAGLGMVDAFLTLYPTADVGHVGFYRDETTHLPQHYYCKIPPGHELRHLFVCDPMLATGGTAIATFDKLKKLGCTQMNFTCIVASPEGIANLHQHHPDITIHTAAIDEKLNDDAYIVPGLGDAGDRLYGTLT